jgi:hypothetical protein
MKGRNMFILCHKCAGVLRTDEVQGNMYGCQCISGYVREWQKPMSRTDAVRQQAAVSVERLRHKQWQVFSGLVRKLISADEAEAVLLQIGPDSHDYRVSVWTLVDMAIHGMETDPRKLTDALAV